MISCFLRVCSSKQGLTLMEKRRLFSKTTTTIHRSPLPPMPRRIMPVQQNDSKAGILRRSWNNGNILITIGWMGVALVVVDRYLQYQQQRNLGDSDQMIKAIAEEAEKRRTALYEEWKDKPTRYQSRIIREYKNMGGSHGLKGLEIGDLVEVLDERVGLGNDKNYNLCRVIKNGQIGWYPIGFMEPVKRRSGWWFL